MRKPYELPYLPVDIDYSAIINKIGKSRTAVGELSGILSHSKNHHLITTPLLTNEAVLSSKIEGTNATVEDVYAYEAMDSHDTGSEKEKDIQEIINYRKAVNIAVKELKKKPISENFIKKIHYVLMNSVRGQNKQRGEFRKTQVHIGKFGAGIEEATYIPPIATKIPKLFSNWEKYIHSEKEPDEFVQIAIAHYQFEAIHPFLDGNGRIGRLLIPLMLYERKLLPTPVLYISRYFDKHRDEYYAKLNNVSEQAEWIAWIEFFLDAIEDQAISTKSKLLKMENLYEQTKNKMSQINSMYAIELLDILYSKPVITYNSIKNEINASPQTIYNLLDKFCEAKILRKAPDKKRNKSYIFKDLLELIKA